jgi:colanic acid/amylovoran biosynthesis glycosyltransferase
LKPAKDSTLEDQTDTVICVVSPEKAVYSETFIRAHVERLPGRVHHLYGGHHPHYHGDGRWLHLILSPVSALTRAAAGRALGPTADFFAATAFRRFLKKNKVSAVLAEYGPTGTAIMHACASARVPLVVHFHGYDAYERAILELHAQEYPVLFHIAAAVIAGSRDMEQHLLALGVPRGKLFYNPCGVDTRMFSGGNPVAAGPVFVTVGRFVDKKAPLLTLLAFEKIVKSCPEARLVMIGAGLLLEACKQTAKALKISDKLQFPGALDAAEVAQAMRRARALVQHSMTTSYGDSEGTSLTILEAGAAGLPVVATRHGGIKDSVVHGTTGFLVEEGDIEGMARRMLELAHNPDLAGQMGKAARQRVLQEFSMEKSIAGLWNIISKSAGLV